MNKFFKLPVEMDAGALIGFAALVIISVAVAKRLPVVSKFV